MKRRIQVLWIAGVTLMLSSCAGYHYKKGNAAYEKYGYAKAIEHYEKALARKDQPDIRRKLADSYRLNSNSGDALIHLTKVVHSDECTSEDLLNYARLLICEERYKDAEYWLVKYVETNPGAVYAQNMLKSCRYIDSLLSDSIPFDLQLVNIEGVKSTFSAVPYQNGIVFSAEKKPLLGHGKNPWTGNSFQRLYYQERDMKGAWKKPVPLKGKINNQFHNATASFNADGTVMYLTRNNVIGNKPVAGNDHEVKLKLYRARLVNGEWLYPEELYFNSDEYSTGHPFLCKDGKTLFFVSDMPGGYGGTDIYRVVCEQGQCFEPENLGPEINTPGNEQFPFFDEKNQELYFSSDVHPGLGGLDIFRSSLKEDKWSQPENVGNPINSSRDDFGFFLREDGKTGYISSNRSSEDRIYAFKKLDPLFFIQGTIADASGEPLPGASVEIVNKTTGERIHLPVDITGSYAFRFQPGADYEVICSADGYFQDVKQINCSDKEISQSFEGTFNLEPIEKDDAVIVKNIYYEFDRSDIREDAIPELNRLVKLLKDNPGISIELGAHADARGDDEYNLQLSDQRAKSVVKYLISQGIPAEAVSAKGYGESFPVNECINGVECPEEKHEENRRTELKVIGITEGLSAGMNE